MRGVVEVAATIADPDVGSRMQAAAQAAILVESRSPSRGTQGASNAGSTYAEVREQVVLEDASEGTFHTLHTNGINAYRRDHADLA